MGKTIVIIGILDTKEDEVRYLQECIERRGHKTIVMDVSMGRRPSVPADITCEETAKAGGASIDEIRASRERGKITQIMTDGAIEKAKELYWSGRLDGIISIGGATAAFIGTSVMKALPFGVPKLMASSNIAKPYGSRYFGTKDIMGMNSVVDIATLNELVKSVLARSAGAICGMVEAVAEIAPTLTSTKPMIAMTEWGWTERCARFVESYLEQKGYQVIPFHAAGVGDRAMDELIREGLFDGIMDIVTGGVSEELFGGPRAGGPDRLEAAGRRGIPQVIAPSGLNVISCGPLDSIAPKYKERTLIELDEFRNLVKMTAEEITMVARTVADKLNKARGPIKLLIPLRGWSDVDREGEPTYEPDINRLFAEDLKKTLKPGIEIKEIDANLEDQDFALALATALDDMMRQRST